jgi:spermidine synthase
MKKRPFDWIREPGDAKPAGRWFVEFFSPGEYHAHKLSRVLDTSDTAFQKAALVSTRAFGDMLIIDGETQSSRLDEAFYHETLVCPALLLHPRPRTALILGGGEGATARELLNCRSIKRVVMADLDYNILRFAREKLGAWHRGAFSVVQDAATLVKNTSEKFDLIYADLPSPIEGGPAFSLYTLEFYRSLKRLLSPGGVFTTQAGPGSPLQFELHCALSRTLKKVFRSVSSGAAYIPSYDLPWTYLYCTDAGRTPARAEAKALDRAAGRLRRPLAFHDGASIKASFCLPKYYNNRINASGAPVTMSRPMFFTTSQRS